MHHDGLALVGQSGVRQPGQKGAREACERLNPNRQDRTCLFGDRNDDPLSRPARDEPETQQPVDAAAPGFIRQDSSSATELTRTGLLG